MRPVASLDQTGTSLKDISKAPVESSCDSMALDTKKSMKQAYIRCPRIHVQKAGVTIPIHGHGSVSRRMRAMTASLRTLNT